MALVYSLMPAVWMGLLLFCEGLLQSKQQHFTISGWSTVPPEDFVLKFKPIFETYLNQEVGPLYDPPIDFTLLPFYYEPANDDHAMIEAGKLDFAYHLGGVLTCLAAEDGYTVIATEVASILGQATSAYGAILYSAKSNTAIKTLADAEGGRLGVGYPWAPESFLLGAELLDEEKDMNIYTHFSQVVFYQSDYKRMLEDVLAGKIDLAMTQSGWLEANFPDKVSLLHYHEVINTTYHAEPYPLPTSTRVVPSFSLAAATHITATLRQQVSAALRRLNASHPAAQGAGLAGFILPASYEESRHLLEQLGLMENTPEGKRCLEMFDGLEYVISCPAKYELKEHDTILRGCEMAGRECPEGMTCFCDPCVLVAENVFPWQLVLGLCGGLFVVGLCFHGGWIDIFASTLASIADEDAGTLSVTTWASKRKTLATDDMAAV